jgi:hypothetical protein
MRNELSREPLVIGSDYSKHPMEGQLSLPTFSAGEWNVFDGDVSTVKRAVEAPYERPATITTDREWPGPKPPCPPPGPLAEAIWKQSLAKWERERAWRDTPADEPF